MRELHAVSRPEMCHLYFYPRQMAQGKTAMPDFIRYCSARPQGMAGLWPRPVTRSAQQIFGCGGLGLAGQPVQR